MVIVIIIVYQLMVLSCKVFLVCSSTYYQCLRKMQYWQLIGIPRPISTNCFYKDICPSPNQYPNLLQLPILHLYDQFKIAASGPATCLQSFFHLIATGW